jgi:hypothetical protein
MICAALSSAPFVFKLEHAIAVVGDLKSPDSPATAAVWGIIVADARLWPGGGGFAGRGGAVSCGVKRS